MESARSWLRIWPGLIVTACRQIPAHLRTLKDGAAIVFPLWLSTGRGEDPVKGGEMPIILLANLQYIPAEVWISI